MELLIKAKNISLDYSDKDILDIEDLELYSYDRIGLVGSNGSGKSTLLKILLGEIVIPGCTINRIGEFTYIPQLDDVTLQQEIKNHALMGKMGINYFAVQHMSGGEETRLKIAQSLSDQVHGIMADEPTCHLDQEGIDFLIGQLQYYSGALLVISHDRYFLDSVVNKIWELNAGKISEYWGNYSDYLEQKKVERQSQAIRYEQFISERDRLSKAADEKRKQANKIEKKSKGTSEGTGRLAHQKSTGSKQKALHNAAKSMEHRISAMEDVQEPESIRTIRFRQSNALALHNPYPIIGSNINKEFDDKVIFNQASFQIPLGSKVALTGGNGTGKTTLLNMIFKHENGITISPKAEMGYFTQNGYKFNRNQKLIEFMQKDCDYKIHEIRSVLASMGFAQSDIQKNLNVLSGGEIIKLLLAKMLLARYNILLMDEPSNFLDIPSVEALESLMQNYNGTIIFVTHDKRLLENVADIVYEIDDGKIKHASIENS